MIIKLYPKFVDELGKITNAERYCNLYISFTAKLYDDIPSLGLEVFVILKEIYLQTFAMKNETQGISLQGLKNTMFANFVDLEKALEILEEKNYIIIYY